MKILVEWFVSDRESIDKFQELAWNTDSQILFFLHFESDAALELWFESTVGIHSYLQRVVGVGHSRSFRYVDFIGEIDKISYLCKNIEVVGTPDSFAARNEKNALFSSGKRYILCVKDSSISVDEQIKEFGNELLEHEIGMCVDFEQLKENTGRVRNVNAYGLSILPYVSMVRFTSMSTHGGVQKWFMKDVLKRGKSVKWLLLSGTWVLTKTSDMYPAISESVLGSYQDLRYVEDQSNFKKRERL